MTCVWWMPCNIRTGGPLPPCRTRITAPPVSIIDCSNRTSGLLQVRSIQRSFLVVAVERPPVCHDGVLGDHERARSMGVTPKKKVDLVGDERKRRMETAQPAVLPIASNAPRQHRDAEAGEREAL